MQNAVLDSWGAYNQRRYGCPWVCVMRADGSYNFGPRVGTYTGNARQGEGGDLVVFEPVVGQVYGYGQKDYRSRWTLRRLCGKTQTTKTNGRQKQAPRDGEEGKKNDGF